jgi:hypothetical protein
MLRVFNLLAAIAMLSLVVNQVSTPGWKTAVPLLLVPCFWALMAGFRHRTFRSVRWIGWLWTCVALWTGLLLVQWWQLPVGWSDGAPPAQESVRAAARTAMGLAVLCLSLLTAYRKR